LYRVGTIDVDIDKLEMTDSGGSKLEKTASYSGKLVTIETLYIETL